jgi:hypothetical protein
VTFSAMRPSPKRSGATVGLRLFTMAHPRSPWDS